MLGKIIKKLGFIPKSRLNDAMHSIVDEVFNHNYTRQHLIG